MNLVTCTIKVLQSATPSMADDAVQLTDCIVIVRGAIVSKNVVARGGRAELSEASYSLLASFRPEWVESMDPKRSLS